MNLGSAVMALTELAIKSFKPKDKLYRVADSGGLCLEITPAGSKLWRWRYNYGGKPQMLAIGKWPSVTLAEARKQREEARELLAQGKHPTRAKKAEKLKAMHDGENTFESLARRWLELKQHGLNEKYRKQCITRMEQHVFPHIGALPITDITIPDVVVVIEKIGNRGTVETAKRMKQLISQTFRYASQRGLCEHNPAGDLRGILPSQEAKHHGCIPFNELPALLNDIDSYRGNDLTRIALKLLAYTFVRTGELIGAQWDEIDWSKEEWHIPKERMKMRRPHIVPLTAQTMALLKEAQHLTGHQAFVFFSPASKSKHISNGAILMALRRMGYQGRMTGHAFRSIASTLLNERGYNPDWIERQLAHQDADKIRSAYNRAEYLLERKKMMQDYASLLDEIKEGGNDKVIDGKFISTAS
jgi:integrase